jgi:hypothetical protein
LLERGDEAPHEAESLRVGFPCELPHCRQISGAQRSKGHKAVSSHFLAASVSTP